MAGSDDTDKESKTEQATEKRLRDAVDKGNVPFSREAATLASLVAMLLVISFFIADGVGRLRSSLERFIGGPGDWSLESTTDVMALLSSVAFETLGILVPMVALFAVAGLAASFFQNPPQLVATRIAPDMSRISISKGFGRIFGKQGFVEFLKALFKLSAVSILSFIMLRGAQADLINAMIMEPTAIPALMLDVTLRLVAAIAAAVAALVGVDLVWTRLFWRENLKMTREEVKEEFKQAEGDPILKSRMRSLARDRVRRNMLAAVPRATVVITNPTHFAVALRYVREEGGAPVVVAKGQDLIALKIREVAGEHGIPIYEDKALARSLYARVEVDQVIPAEFYKAVAEIVIYFMSRSGGPRTVQ